MAKKPPEKHEDKAQDEALLKPLHRRIDQQQIDIEELRRATPGPEHLAGIADGIAAALKAAISKDIEALEERIEERAETETGAHRELLEAIRTDMASRAKHMDLVQALIELLCQPVTRVGEVQLPEGAAKMTIVETRSPHH